MSSAAVELADWSFDTTRTQMRGEDDIGQGGIAPRPRHLTLRGRLGWSYRVRATPPTTGRPTALADASQTPVGSGTSPPGHMNTHGRRYRSGSRLRSKERTPQLGNPFANSASPRQAIPAVAYVRVFQAVHPQCDHTSVMGWKSTGADLEAVWARARSLSRLWDKLEERGMGLPASGYRNEDWGRCRLITRALPHTRRGHIGPSYKCTRNGI